MAATNFMIFLPEAWCLADPVHGKELYQDLDAAGT